MNPAAEAASATHAWIQAERVGFAKMRSSRTARLPPATIARPPSVSRMATTSPVRSSPWTPVSRSSRVVLSCTRAPSTVSRAFS